MLGKWSVDNNKIIEVVDTYDVVYASGVYRGLYIKVNNEPAYMVYIQSGLAGDYIEVDGELYYLDECFKEV